MAFTKQEHEDLLKEIAASGGDTPKMLELMQKLRDDFDEREGMLKKLGEKRDSETPEGTRAEEEKIRDESRKDNEEDGGERRKAYDALGDTVSRADYEALRRKYIDRFFSDPQPQGPREEPEEPRAKTFDDLWK